MRARRFLVVFAAGATSAAALAFTVGAERRGALGAGDGAARLDALPAAGTFDQGHRKALLHGVIPSVYPFRRKMMRLSRARRRFSWLGAGRAVPRGGVPR